MSHEAIFLASCNGNGVALQVARLPRVTPHVSLERKIGLPVAEKEEAASAFRNATEHVSQFFREGTNHNTT